MSATSRALLGWLAVCGVVLLTAVLVIASDASAQEGGEDASAFLERGETLYSVNCAGCHGGDGRGGQTVDGQAVPGLTDTDRITIAYMRMVMATGRMPPAGDPRDNRIRHVSLSPTEQEAIVTWTAEAFGLDGDIEDPGQGDVAEGLRVYAANCAQCHGASGAGGVAGAGAWTPRVNDVSSQTLADAIRTGPFQMPRFDASQITDEEMADIAAFLHEVDEEGGTLLFPGELNPVFASGFGAGLAAVIVLALMFISGKPQMFPDHPPEEPVPGSAAGPDEEAGA